MWFDPSTAEVTYEGSYAPLRGLEMSRAYASTLEISFDVRGGFRLRTLSRVERASACPGAAGPVHPVFLGWPFFEAWVAGDRGEHDLLQRPGNAPGARPFSPQ